MQRGPRPQPQALQELHGNPSGNPTPAMVPDGVGDLWAPPAWFDDDLRAQWDYALENAPSGVLTGTDRDALVVYCVAVVEHAAAARELRRSGLLVEGAHGNMVANPLQRIVNHQALILLRAANELGFTPAARTALGRAHDAAMMAGGSRYIGGAKAKPGGLDAYLDEKPDRLQ